MSTYGPALRRVGKNDLKLGAFIVEISQGCYGSDNECSLSRSRIRLMSRTGHFVSRVFQLDLGLARSGARLALPLDQKDDEPVLLWLAKRPTLP
jgi:hypothetical protein